MVTTRSRIRTAQVGIITPRWLHCQNLNDLTHVLVHSDQEECSTTKAEKRKPAKNTTLYTYTMQVPMRNVHARHKLYTYTMKEVVKLTAPTCIG